MTDSKPAKGARLGNLVLALLGEGELLLVDLDGLLVVVHLDQDVPHVGQGAELGLVVLGDLGNG